MTELSQSSTFLAALAAKAICSRITINAVDYGLPTDGVSDCSTVLNSLMATVAAQGGGTIECPVATMAVAAPIDNKYSNVLVVGGSKTEDTNAGSGRNFGTTIVPSFAGTVLKHRTPYSASSAQFTGGGFMHFRVIGNGVATRLLEVDSILSGTYDLYLYESVGADAAWFHCGVSGTDLAECRGVQNTRINLRIRQDGQSGASAAASADCVIFDGSSNANFSFNDDITLDIVHKNGRGAYFKGCDNNFVRRIRVYRSAGGSGNGIIMGGRSTAQGNVGGEQTLFGLVSCNSPIVAEAQGTGGTGIRFNKILALDTGNWPSNLPTTADSSATWEWDDVLGSGSWVWTDFTPTYSADGGALGTITTSSARYSRHKKTVRFNIQFQIVGAGTATGALRIAGMPTPVVSQTFAAAGADTSAGKVLTAFWSAANSAVRIASATGTTPIVAGDFYVVSGEYEVSS